MLFWREATVVHLWLGWKGFLSASCHVWVCIDSSDGMLAEEMASFVSYGSVMANHLLGAVNWQTPILVRKHPWGFYWLPLQLLHLMWLAQWGPKLVKVLQKKSITCCPGKFCFRMNRLNEDISQTCFVMFILVAKADVLSGFSIFYSRKIDFYNPFNYTIAHDIHRSLLSSFGKKKKEKVFPKSSVVLMNRCLHNTAHLTDGYIISIHYGSLSKAKICVAKKTC